MFRIKQAHIKFYALVFLFYLQRIKHNLFLHIISEDKNMNHREINNELYSNTEDNEIYIKEGGDKIEQQLNGQKK